jgi:predicted MPP superfamily phosphohydrolase
VSDLVFLFPDLMNYRSLAIVSVLFHLFVGLRLVSGLDGQLAGQLALSAGLLLSALLMPLGLTGSRSLPRPWGDRVSWMALLAMGYFSSLLMLTLLRDLILVALWLFDVGWSGQLPWASLHVESVKNVLLLALLLSLAGFLNARRTASVVRVDVPIRGLPMALHGFTLIQITDIHVGPTIKHDYVQRIVDKVNSLKPDVVAVTGDLVDGSVAELHSHVAPLAGLKSRHGTFFVTGNHEYYSGAHAWIVELRRIGLTVLLNEHVVLHHGAMGAPGAPFQGDAQDDSQIMAALVLAGVTDYSAHHFDPKHLSDPVLALEGSPESVAVRLLLAHQPRTAPAAAEAGFDLQVSGHTHGGQFYPWNLFVPLQQPYVSGLNRLQKMWVYTSRGTGYWGPPKRFGAPSEITVLRLVRE